jgi:hypothetical protein
MIKKHLITTVIIGVAILFVSAAIYAKSAPDVIPLQDPAYETHKKGVVQFDHKKHWDDYSKEYKDLYPNKCGECHHDDKGKPLTKLKDGDDVQKCIECHKIAAEAPKGKKEAFQKGKNKRVPRRSTARKLQGLPQKVQ